MSAESGARSSIGNRLVGFRFCGGVFMGWEDLCGESVRGRSWMLGKNS